jgi:ubiquinone/menaquinone biosynthesis C-methylase UbiE
MSAPKPLMTPAELWRKYDAVESRLSARLSERMLDLAGVRPGTRLLDLATGRGEPVIRAARRVGPRGLVVGVELSDDLLQMARDKAAREGLSNLELQVGDAQRLEGFPVGGFDVVTSRWGLMYGLPHRRALGRPTSSDGSGCRGRCLLGTA